MKELRQIGLILNFYKEECIALGRAVIDWFGVHDIGVLALAEEAEALGIKACAREVLGANADLVIVIGGDGTLLRAARTVYGYGVPIIGINQGYLGFLTEIELSDVGELDHYFTALLKGEYTVEKRMMLMAQVWRDGKKMGQLMALNDLVITKGALARIISLEIFQENVMVDHYLGDGVIFSTPTGSTGYSLSAGGPIVYPNFDLCIVTPICPHTLSARPIIFPPDQTLKVKLGCDNFQAMLTVDGQYGLELENKDEIFISQAGDYTYLLKMKNRNFFQVMREKLKSTDGNKYDQ